MPSHIIFFIAFVISFFTVPLLISLANNSGAIALPGKRHIHSHPTPKFGGIAIAAGVLFITPIIIQLDRVVGSYLASSVIMLSLGIIDDLKGASWRLKLLFSVTATSIMVFGADVWIRDLGNLLIFSDIELGLWGIPFTYFAIFGIVNAINLIDGLNGLACGVSSIAFIAFAIFASISGNETVLFLSLANLGATLGLFKYNYPKAQIFMGDSGSLFLGFSLAILSILLTQGDAGKINPMVPVVVLGIPIFDTLRVMSFRMISKRHPFTPDKTHLHHLMLRSNLHPKRVVKIIWVLSALMASLAFVLYNQEAWVMLLVLCIIVASIGVFIENLKIIKTNRAKNG